MKTSAPRSIRHGDLPNAILAAACAILDEQAGPHEVGLRETARRVGVSATAAYRYFPSREDLLASVAAEGFRELAAAIELREERARFANRTKSRLCRVRAQKARSVPADVRPDIGRADEISAVRGGGGGRPRCPAALNRRRQRVAL